MTGATPFTSIPIVDISGLRSADRAEHERVAAEIGRAAREVGFLYVSRTGIDEALFDRMLAATKTFFALPVEEKMRSYIGLSSCHRGYVPVGEEGVETGTPDLKEAFDTALDLPDDDPDHVAGNPMLGPNVWPDVDGFAEAVTDYYHAVMDLGISCYGHSRWHSARTPTPSPDTPPRRRVSYAWCTIRSIPMPRTSSASERTPTTSASPCSSRPPPVSRCSTVRATGSTSRQCPTPSWSTSATCSNCGPTAHTSRPVTGSARCASSGTRSRCSSTSTTTPR